MQEKLQPLGAFRELQILSCDSQDSCLNQNYFVCMDGWLIILTSVGMWIFKRETSTCNTHTKQKGGPVTSIPINSCQSGNRPVNLEGPGCGGGNDRVKGSLVPSSLAHPQPSHSLLDTPCLTLCLTLYHLISTWPGHRGRKRRKRAGSHRFHLHLKNFLSGPNFNL